MAAGSAAPRKATWGIRITCLPSHEPVQGRRPPQPRPRDNRLARPGVTRVGAGPCHGYVAVLPALGGAISQFPLYGLNREIEFLGAICHVPWYSLNFGTEPGLAI